MNAFCDIFTRNITKSRLSWWWFRRPVSPKKWQNEERRIIKTDERMKRTSSALEHSRHACLTAQDKIEKPPRRRSGSYSYYHYHQNVGETKLSFKSRSSFASSSSSSFSAFMHIELVSYRLQDRHEWRRSERTCCSFNKAKQLSPPRAEIERKIYLRKCVYI